VIKVRIPEGAKIMKTTVKTKPSCDEDAINIYRRFIVACRPVPLFTRVGIVKDGPQLYVAKVPLESVGGKPGMLVELDWNDEVAEISIDWEYA
jgi:hypothetical protein